MSVSLETQWRAEYWNWRALVGENSIASIYLRVTKIKIRFVRPVHDGAKETCYSLTNKLE